MVIRDDSSPTFSSQPSGPLTSATATTRVRSLTYGAVDIGGGVFSQRLVVDGVQLTGGLVDANGGRCERYSIGDGFASPVPCRTSASGELSFDTASLSDGLHAIELRVTDATDINTLSKSWTITVDNLPPVIDEVTLSGSAREGDVLRCSAAVNGQAAAATYRWLRAAPDGSGEVVVPGATAAEYTVTAADVGRKLLCRVTATDSGGTTTKTSSWSSGPFAGDTVVATRSGGATTDGSGAAGGNGGAGGAGGRGPSELPALAACTRRTVTMVGAPTQLTRSYRGSGVSLGGRLTDVATGRPVGGAGLAVMQTITRAGVSRRTTAITGRTNSDGVFRVAVPRGPTRKLQLVDTGCGAVGTTITERVRGGLQARTTTRRVRNRQLARFSGRVLGGHLGRGLPLELQVKVGRSWRDVKAMTSNARGEYRVSYRFLRTYVRYTYKFRVVSRGGSAWPYMAARSPVVRVRVN